MLMPQKGLETEVCVVGAGPAGSTIARRLAQLGHEVYLIEQAVFPRRHVGESLSPNILPLFDVLGFRERMEAASFLRPERAIVWWSETGGSFRSQSRTPGFQVDRAVFDQILLDAAEAAGVRVIQPARVLGLKRSEMIAPWYVRGDCRGELFDFRARFLVDATGRRSLLQNHKKRCSAPTLAIYAYWRNARIEGPETRVEAGADEWFWGAPLPDGSFNATVFVDPFTCAGGRRALEAIYRAKLAQSSLLSGCLSGEISGPVEVCAATSCMDEDPVNENSIKVGEASVCIDPLSSQGVQAAMQSALQGSIVVHTLLARPANASPAIQFYRDRQTETAEFHARLAARCYAEQRAFRHRMFWQRRARLSANKQPVGGVFEKRVLDMGSSVRVSAETTLADVPCIRDDFVLTLPAIIHPNLDRPVVFIGGIEIGGLLAFLSQTRSLREILQRWSTQISADRSMEVLSWLIAHGVIGVEPDRSRR
jgi:flavin-dependent dehydrogenase